MSGAAARVIAVLFVLLEETARRVHLWGMFFFPSLELNILVSFVRNSNSAGCNSNGPSSNLKALAGT